jgi:hypothetical protein
MAGGLLTDLGKRTTALYWANNLLHGAVGSGTWVDKFNPDLENFHGAGLTNEFGRIAIEAVRYLVPDPLGTVNYVTGFDALGHPIVDGPYRYATALETAASAALVPPVAPSSDLEVQFTIPPNVAVGQVICELAVFLGSHVTVPGWATPAQVDVPGHPLYLVNIGAKTIEANESITRRVRLSA